ncbi:uncharacterized protein LOC122208487 isoform X2 [Panthera leo]|uniref:uncharacterized protein LOC122208487 isoform X2 n=1 Tax=Panthera leo TaxID=9689 RepID=UPI001C6A2D14|nr:uncharacterized protein LOC122208487 isoform X2 [Panthera leo]
MGLSLPQLGQTQRRTPSKEKQSDSPNAARQVKLLGLNPRSVTSEPIGWPGGSGPALNSLPATPQLQLGSCKSGPALCLASPGSSWYQSSISLTVTTANIQEPSLGYCAVVCGARALPLGSCCLPGRDQGMRLQAGQGGTGRGMWHRPMLTSGSPPAPWASWVRGSKKKKPTGTLGEGQNPAQAPASYQRDQCRLPSALFRAPKSLLHPRHPAQLFVSSNSSTLHQPISQMEKQSYIHRQGGGEP